MQYFLKKLYQSTVPNIENKINDFNDCIKIIYYEIYLVVYQLRLTIHFCLVGISFRIQ